MKSLLPENVKSENYKFYKITQGAYIFGAISHLVVGFVFLALKVYEMVWFNFVFSVPVFLFSYCSNRRGRHSLAFSLAFIELLFHQVAAVYFIGWNSGLQYFLIYLAGLTFFNAYWKKAVRLARLSVISCTFIVLYMFFRIPEVYILSDSIYDLSYLSASLSTLLGLALLINYYVQAANKAENSLRSANQQLSDKNIQIEQALSERNQVLTHLNQELTEAADYVRTILPHPIADGKICTDWRFIPCTSLGGC